MGIHYFLLDYIRERENVYTYIIKIARMVLIELLTEVHVLSCK
jgi:hypothetical protein